MFLIVASNDHTGPHDPENTVVVHRWCNFVCCPCHHHNTVNTCTVRSDPEPSLPPNGTPHLQDNHDDTHDDSENTNFDRQCSVSTNRQCSVSTTDAVSQGKDGN